MGVGRLHDAILTGPGVGLLTLGSTLDRAPGAGRKSCPEQAEEEEGEKEVVTR